LRLALESCMRQTYRDLEVIVVDDASGDNTREVVAGFGPNVKYILQDNLERAAARNNGIKNARGDMVAFLDSDDVWEPEHLEKCLQALKDHPGADVAYSGSYIIDSHGAIIGKLPFRRSRGDVLKKMVAEYSSGGCNASSCLIKKSVFRTAGYFNEDRGLSGSEDWEMWVRLAGATGFASTDCYTSKVRFHPGKSSINAQRMARSMEMALGLVYQNSRLLPRISGLKARAYSSLYCIIAINFYAAGEMETSRRYLGKAFRAYPLSAVSNTGLVYTFARTFLGQRLSLFLRRMKQNLRKSI